MGRSSCTVHPFSQYPKVFNAFLDATLGLDNSKYEPVEPVAYPCKDDAWVAGAQLVENLTVH